MAASPRRLERILRVRTLQLGLTQAEEARAHARVVGEEALAARIGELVMAVSPTPVATGAASLGAAAHFRERLLQSAAGADERLRAAEALAAQAAARTRSARQDHSAVEKLIERAAADAALVERRGLESLAPAGRKRHDPC